MVGITLVPDCGADWAGAPAPGAALAFNLTRWTGGFFTSPRKRGEGEGSPPRYADPTPFIIARRASARPISTKAEVTSGPPTKIRVGVFILFHS